MKTPKSLYSRLALTTSVTLVVGYFVVYAAWTSISDVTGGQTLTATLINNILGNLTDLNDRVSNFSFSAGNVGIGTASPVKPLEVYGDIGSTNPLNTAQIGQIRYYGVVGYGGDIQVNAQSANTNLILKSSGVERVRIDPTGKVGIGTASPSDTLTVNGGVTANTFTSPIAWSAIPATAGWTSNAACRRIGSFLQIRKHINYTSGVVTPTWATPIGVLPVECRPPLSIYIPSICWTNAQIASACLTVIDTDGQVYLDASSSLNYVSFAGTFPAN
ncbi:MAG: hypothetical protein Q8K26_05240 [Candidatus Gracilibacteria bacterium]|nr:hypothetical protein [Candidatus Gracilibacteria bacterium]